MDLPLLIEVLNERRQVSRRHVPVHMGSPQFRTVVTPGALTTEAWFPPRSVLASHTHERMIFAVMLGGSFETAVAAQRLECVPTAVWTEPAEERHANFIGPLGARVLVIQPDPARADVFEAFRTLLEDVNYLRHPGIVSDARRIVSELGTGDPLSPLAIDALTVGMMTVASRLSFRDRHHRHAPAWLLRIRDLLHEGVARRMSLMELADTADVHPTHLAHAFRRHFRMTLGEYARGLRLHWALERLAQSDTPISEIAVAAGYADQSHLTRECRRAISVTPAHYRRQFRKPRSGQAP